MSIPNRYDKWLNQQRAREAQIRVVEDACDALDRQSDYLADTTPFGQALRNYVDGLIGHPMRWRMVP